MLTIVSDFLQPSLTRLALTLVDMGSKTLKFHQRLSQAMEFDHVEAADLARACHVSRAAVSKWTSGKVDNLKNEHLFVVARRCGVDAEWLGTGAGEPRKSGKAPPAGSGNGLTEMGARVGKKWQSLDEPARGQILMLIETLGALQSENYRKYGIEQQRILHSRAETAK
jgi:transcriptional regulator with XRE-family HTH domain